MTEETGYKSEYAPDIPLMKSDAWMPLGAAYDIFVKTGIIGGAEKPQPGLSDELIDALYPSMRYNEAGVPIKGIEPLLSFEQQMRIGTMSDLGALIYMFTFPISNLIYGWNAKKNEKVKIPATKTLPLKELNDMYMARHGESYLKWINGNTTSIPATPKIVEEAEYNAAGNLMGKKVSTITEAGSAGQNSPLVDYLKAMEQAKIFAVNAST
ncbi:MAG TPA: hypothetical protein VJH90_02610 [archaeon]|nr:hypothetical protein [archaeon]